jgi:hypothetical protein
MIILESALGFLGLGVQPPIPPWGNMLADGRDYIRDARWVATFPGLVIMLTAAGVNFLGDGLRDLFDPTIQPAGQRQMAHTSAFDSGTQSPLATFAAPKAPPLIMMMSSCSESSPSTVSARWIGKSGASTQARQSGRLLSLADTFWPLLQGYSPAGSRRMRHPCHHSASSKSVSSWRPLRMAKPQTAFAMPLLSTYDTVDREVAERP